MDLRLDTDWHLCYRISPVYVLLIVYYNKIAL